MADQGGAADRGGPFRCRKGHNLTIAVLTEADASPNPTLQNVRALNRLRDPKDVTVTCRKCKPAEVYVFTVDP